MTDKQTTLALIGAGKWGKNYLASCNGFPDIKIGYVLAKSKKTLNKLPDKYSKTTKIKDLMNKKSISGFIVTSPTSTHFEIAKILIQNNKNVLIEKPVCDSYKKTKFLFDLSNKHPKSIVMAGHIQLYDPNYAKLKKDIVKIGAIKSLKYDGLKSPKRKDVNVFWDWLPHPLYLFSDITRKNPKIISVKFTKPDNLVATVLLDKNIIGKIHVGWTYPIKKRSFIITGEKGEITLRTKKGKYTPLQNELLTFAECIRQKKQPPSSLKQALEVARVISQVEKQVR